MASGKGMYLQDPLLDSGVGFAGGEGLHKPQKSRIRRFIMVFQQLLHHVSLQQHQFSLVADAESRVQVQAAEMLPDQVQAKAVDGGNLRIGHQRRLYLQMGIFRPFLQPLFNGLENPFPHFRRGGIGKGHHQQLVQICRIRRVGNQLQNPFHQHRGFSAAGGGGHQQIPIAGLDHLFLFFRPVHCRSSSPRGFPVSSPFSSPPPMRSQTSSGFRGAKRRYRYPAMRESNPQTL